MILGCGMGWGVWMCGGGVWVVRAVRAVRAVVRAVFFGVSARLLVVSGAGFFVGVSGRPRVR